MPTDLITDADVRVVRVERLELAFAPRPWPWADRHRAEIDAHFTALRRDNPTLWNGRVLLMHSHALAGAVFRGAYLETDYASLLAWRDWRFPDRDMRNSYSLAAVKSADGGFLLGVMNAHTANAGHIYFPCGTPDPSDVIGGGVDLDASLRRELAEETGLDAGEFEPEPGWYTVFAGARIAQIKVLHARDTAAALRERAIDHLRREQRPELADIRVVRSLADLDPAMPKFVTAFLRNWWR
jgi:8-oxo-dGTP pyrophosphatase MutT (NUDIX family)